MLVSYCVRTNHAKKREFHETIKSILKQKGDKEIIVCGILPDTYEHFKEIRFFDCTEWASQGYTSKMRDKGFIEAQGDYIVAMDDDILLDEDFQQNIGKEEIQIPRCSNIMSGRFWDWCVFNHPELGHRKVAYDFPYCEYHYLSGQCFVIKSDVAKNCLHETDLLFHENDDVDYGKKLQSKGNVFTMNTALHCVHNDDRYSSVGQNDEGILRVG